VFQIKHLSVVVVVVAAAIPELVFGLGFSSSSSFQLLLLL